MKANLNILERVVIMNILPRTGSFVNVRAVKNTTKILTITKEEEKEIELARNGATTTWNDEGTKPKEFDLPASSVKVIRDALKDLDAKGTLPVDAVTTYEKFLSPTDEAEITDADAPA